jgi:hypothetical protein
MTEKERKQINGAYEIAFKRLLKAIFTDKKQGLALFTEYLKYLRDFIIIREPYDESEHAKLKLATIITAIAEFEAYTKAEESQKAFHWNNFCELIKQNMEDWLDINDTV